MYNFHHKWINPLKKRKRKNDITSEACHKMSTSRNNQENI